MWALAHLDYLTGRLLTAGVDPKTLDSRDWLDVAYYAMITMPDGLVDRYDVIARANEQLSKPVAEWLEGTPKGIDRDEWMRSPQAQAGQRAMLTQAGGPAPMRDPEAERPEAWKSREG